MVPSRAAVVGLVVLATGCDDRPHAALGLEGAFGDQRLFVEPESNASRQADRWRRSDPAAAAVMDEVAARPIATWLGDWLPDVVSTVSDALDRADGDLQVFTVYDIPERDCGAYSAGGEADRNAYADFVSQVAEGLGGRAAIVILEPDALALDDCLAGPALAERHQMLSDAVDTLTAGGAAVYLDAGDSDWIPAPEMAERLRAAGVARAAGFATNVSHTERTRDEIAYAEELRRTLGREVHYVIDTSRNGLGPTDDAAWCNPRGRAHGADPTLHTGVPGLDALLWVKRPGESDGECGGGPRAGAWWPEYALELADLAGL